jgi:hypothetical protein
MINHPNSDIESLYSEQDQANENTVFALEDSTAEDSDISTSIDSDESINNPFPIFMSKYTNDSPPCVQKPEVSPQPILKTDSSQKTHVQLSLLQSLINLSR